MSSQSRSLADILPEVHAELPGCPPPIIRRECRRVLKDFCIKTKSWTVQLDPFSLVAGEADVELEGWNHRESTIDAVMSVTLSGRLLKPITDYSMPTRGVIRLRRVPTADKSDALVVSVSLKPSNTVTTFTCQQFCEMWDHNLECIAAGVKFGCLSMNGTGWYNINQAAVEKKAYTDMRVAERIRVQKAGTNGLLYMRPRTPWVTTFSRSHGRSII